MSTLASNPLSEVADLDAEIEQLQREDQIARGNLRHRFRADFWNGDVSWSQETYALNYQAARVYFDSLCYQATTNYRLTELPS